jgi:hypothetical protein
MIFYLIIIAKKEDYTFCKDYYVRKVKKPILLIIELAPLSEKH